MRIGLIRVALLGVLGLGLLRGELAGQTAAPAAEHKPTLWLIGDSTVRNGTLDNGATAGQWGWGHLLHYYFDESRISIVNDAMGGTSSRSYYESGTLWKLVLPKIQAGDYVMMQFGHNDSPATLRGNGDETGEKAGARGGPAVTVHSFGWYMRQYIQEVKAKGATPIVLSPIPRNMWKDGKVLRASKDYGKWAEEAAKAEGAAFVDLNELIAKKYDELGADKVKGFFPGDHTHTNLAGARFNAGTVVEGLKGLKDCPLCNDLAATAPTFEEKP